MARSRVATTRVISLACIEARTAGAANVTCAILAAAKLRVVRHARPSWVNRSAEGRSSHPGGRLIQSRTAHEEVDYAANFGSIVSFKSWSTHAPAVRLDRYRPSRGKKCRTSTMATVTKIAAARTHAISS